MRIYILDLGGNVRKDSMREIDSHWFQACRNLDLRRFGLAITVNLLCEKVEQKSSEDSQDLLLSHRWIVKEHKTTEVRFSESSVRFHIRRC